jgi:hypothetical protein
MQISYTHTVFTNTLIIIRILPDKGEKAMKYLDDLEARAVKGGCDHCPKGKVKEKLHEIFKPNPEEKDKNPATSSEE